MEDRISVSKITLKKAGRSLYTKLDALRRATARHRVENGRSNRKMRLPFLFYMDFLFPHPSCRIYFGIPRAKYLHMYFLRDGGVVSTRHAEFISASQALSNSSYNKPSYICKMLFKQGYVYIMSNQYKTTFYIGVTSNLDARIWQHINNEGSAFVKKYKLYDLVYFEYCERITDAINREKQLKGWHKDWKINLIRSVNPEMKDLKDQLELADPKE